MAIEIDTRVTPSLHPRNLEELPGYDEETAEYVRPAILAFESAYAGIGQVHSARVAAAKNPEWNAAAQVLQTQTFADRIERSVLAKFDAAHSQLKKSVDSLEKQLSEPLESRAAHSIAAEIRLHVKSMKNESERINFVRRAITQGDYVTTGSVLGAPSYLSGFGSEMQEQLTRMWHETSTPAVARRLSVMKGALDLLERRGISVVQEIQKGVGKTIAEVNQLREAKKLAEASFSMPGA